MTVQILTQVFYIVVHTWHIAYNSDHKVYGKYEIFIESNISSQNIIQKLNSLGYNQGRTTARRV